MILWGDQIRSGGIISVILLFSLYLIWSQLTIFDHIITLKEWFLTSWMYMNTCKKEPQKLARAKIKLLFVWNCLPPHWNNPRWSNFISKKWRTLLIWRFLKFILPIINYLVVKTSSLKKKSLLPSLVKRPPGGNSKLTTFLKGWPS